MSIFLHSCATNSRSPSDSAHRSEWSKCATIMLSFGCTVLTKSSKTILSTPPLTARIILSLSFIYCEKLCRNEKIILFINEKLELLIDFSDKSKKCIIWGDHIHHFFPTFLTFLTDHIALIFPMIYPDRLHESMTCRESVSWFFLIHMLRIEAIWTVIACTSCGMQRHFFFAIFTYE